MNESPIINVRRELRWHRRLFSDASTAMLWGGWLWLCRPAISTLVWLSGTRLGAHLPVARHVAGGVVAASLAPVSIENTALALLCTSSLLLLWNHVSARQALRPKQATLPDYAGYFGLPEQDIQKGRTSSVCVVHHDEHGRIVKIQDRGVSCS